MNETTVSCFVSIHFYFHPFGGFYDTYEIGTKIKTHSLITFFPEKKVTHHVTDSVETKGA